MPTQAQTTRRSESGPAHIDLPDVPGDRPAETSPSGNHNPITIGGDHFSYVNIAGIGPSINVMRIYANIAASSEHHGLSVKDQLAICEYMETVCLSIDPAWKKHEWDPETSLYDLILTMIDKVHAWADKYHLNLHYGQNPRVMERGSSHEPDVLIAYYEHGDCFAKMPHMAALKHLEGYDKTLWRICAYAIARVSKAKGVSIVSEYDRTSIQEEEKEQIMDTIYDLETTLVENRGMLGSRERNKFLKEQKTAEKALDRHDRIIDTWESYMDYCRVIATHATTVKEKTIRELIRRYPWKKRMFYKRILVWLRITEQLLATKDGYKEYTWCLEDHDVIAPGGYEEFRWTDGDLHPIEHEYNQFLDDRFNNEQMIPHRRAYPLPLKRGVVPKPIGRDEFPQLTERWMSHAAFLFSWDFPALYKGYSGKKAKAYLKKIDRKTHEYLKH